MTDEAPIDLLAIEAFAWAPFLETTCEVCLRESAAGKRVAFAFLDVDNYDEFLEPAFIRWSCVSGWIYRILHRTRLRKVRAIERLLRSHGVTVLSSEVAAADVPALEWPETGLRSADDLRHFRVEGAALGMGVLSSLIFHCQDSEPDLRVCRRLANRLLTSAYRSFSLAADLIQRHRPAQVLVFNGRFACSKGIEQAALVNGVNVLYQEAGATCDRYYLSRHRPHKVATMREMIVDDWAHAGPGREALAERFFKPARGGTQLMETILYRNRQKHGLTLRPRGRRRIVYFASSMHEHAAVEDGTAEALFSSQHEAVEWLVAWVRSAPDTELVIRLHPRMAGLSPREQLWWEAFTSENVTVVSAENPVDSYALAATADRVVVFRSSLGPEATHMGRVTIAVGDALYIGLDCVHEPKTTAELGAMLVDRDLQPKPAANCLPLAYYRMNFGIPFRWYQPTTFKTGAFFGRPVPRYPDVVSRGLAKLLSLLHRCLPGSGMTTRQGSRA